MPADDSIKPAVVAALTKDGWSITDDPLTVEFGDLYLFIDLGAMKVVKAERGMEKIAVEIKSFPGRSKVADLQQAVGQYAVYRAVLRRIEPERKLYLAVSKEIYERVFVPVTGQVVRSEIGIELLVVSVDSEEIISWET
jgi:hypothetical protein